MNSHSDLELSGIFPQGICKLIGNSVHSYDTISGKSNHDDCVLQLRLWDTSYCDIAISDGLDFEDVPLERYLIKLAEQRECEIVGVEF